MNIDILLQNVQTLVTTPQDVAKLRQLILALAVQGKLVPQEEPSVEIGKNNSEANFSNLPLSWKLQSLEDTTDIIRGVTFPGNVKSKTRDSKYVACLRTASVQKSIDWDDLIYIPQEYVKNTSQWVKKNDIVISMANSYELVGKVAIVRDVPEKATFGAFLGIVRSSILDAEYLMIVLSCPIIQSQFRESSSQTTNIANISLGKLRSITIPVPPLAEQRRIVARVDALMAHCDQLEAQLQERQRLRQQVIQAAVAQVKADPSPASIATLLDPRVGASPADLRQTILALAVQGKLVPQEAGDEPVDVLLRKLTSPNTQVLKKVIVDASPFTIPQTWKWITLQDVATLITSGSRDWAEYYAEEGANFIRMGNLSKNSYKLRLNSIQKVNLPPNIEGGRTKLQAGDILVSITGDVGMMGLIPEGFGEAYINQHVCLVRLPVILQNRYIAEYLRSSYAQRLLNEPQRGLKNSFRLSDMSALPIPLPPLAEQRRIVARVDELMALVDRLEAQQTQASALGAEVLDAVVGQPK